MRGVEEQRLRGRELMRVLISNSLNCNAYLSG